MKFSKTYQNLLKEPVIELPELGLKRLKKTLKKCNGDHVSSDNGCPVCDEKFFPALYDEMSAVVTSFNRKVERLIDKPLTKSVFWDFLLCCKKIGLPEYNAAVVKKAHYLLIYAIINAVAFKKILKKYDKVHNCKKGQIFKSSAQREHIDIIHSPWRYELMALHIISRDTQLMNGEEDSIFKGLALTFDDDQPILSWELFGTPEIEVELKCPICLDPVFDAVALTCGHLMCYICACGAAKVDVVHGLKTAASTEKCPNCQETGVYGSAIRLKELNKMLSKRCAEYWAKRLKEEKSERLRQIKEHWQIECRDFVGN